MLVLEIAHCNSAPDRVCTCGQVDADILFVVYTDRRDVRHINCEIGELEDRLH